MKSIKVKNKAQKISYKLAPYLFITVAILTAFGSSHGTWVWMISLSKVWINIGQFAF